MVLTSTITSFLASLSWHVAVVLATGTAAQVAFEHKCICTHVNIIMEIKSLACHFYICLPESMTEQILSVFCRGVWGSAQSCVA